MKKRIKLLAAVAVIIALCFSAVACSKKGGEEAAPWFDGLQTEYPGVSSNTLYVEKVNNIPKRFIMGMDSSAVPSLEEAGVKFYDYDGNEADVFKTLSENGINAIRVRVWKDPYDNMGRGYGGGNCDLNNAINIGKRATQYGMGLIVDFHYSDFWADPNKQMVPKEWEGYNILKKEEAVYNYTKESLNALIKENIRITMVQIGNETNGEFCGETNWTNISSLMSQGSKAVREVCPDALVALHFANPENVTRYPDYASKLDYYGVDYDVFGSSYYPYWHGTLENLKTQLNHVAENYGKKVMVLETAYAYSEQDYDFGGNSGLDGVRTEPFTLNGQANAVRNVIQTVADTKNGIGVCYWEGTWIPAGGRNYNENLALWNDYGCGWASDYAVSYDPDDAGEGGGTQVDNQTFFDSTGHPLESLKVFALARTGNTEVPIYTDALDETEMVLDVNTSAENFVLPSKVNAVKNSGARVPVDVTWTCDDDKKAQILSGGVKMWTIYGTAEEMQAVLKISVEKKNYLKNGDFEEDLNQTAVPTGWTVVDSSPNCEELYVLDKVGDAHKGTKSFHFYNKPGTEIHFTLEQKIDNSAVSAGSYMFMINIQGGDAATQDITAYVKINGEKVKTAELSITKWKEWNTATISNITVDGTSEIIVGIEVKCTGGTKKGAWGTVDDARFNSMS